MLTGSLSALSSCGGKSGDGKGTGTSGGTLFDPASDPTANRSDSGLSVGDLRVCQTANPIGIDTVPAFCWVVYAEGFSKKQSAYRIAVSSDKSGAEKDEPDIWDSGKTECPDNYNILYTGEKELSSKSTYYWTVTVWDESGNKVTSKPALFKTGMMKQSDWQGKWITAASKASSRAGVNGAYWIWDNGAVKTTSANASLAAGTRYFRSLFTLDRAVSSAVLSFTADDYGAVYINGTLIKDVKNATDIWKSGNVIDVTFALKTGDNLIAAAITNSSVGYAGFVAKLAITFADGTTKNVVTNGSDWKLSAAGSDGFESASFDDSEWVAPTQVVSYGSSPWNEQATFASGANDRAAHLLRRDFTAKKDVAEAMAYVCGLGLFELTVNGKTADDTLLNPCNTQYSQTCLYRAFDITSLIDKGKNAVGLELGNGFYNEQGGVWNWGGAEWRDDPKALVNIVLRYTDGSEDIIVSDESWKGTLDGPITFNSIYYGESYDARLEKEGWNEPGYNASGWSAAAAAKAPEGKLVCQLEDPIRRVASFKPASIKKLSGGSYLVTAPEYITGWAEIKMHGLKSGDEVTVTYAEKKNPNGTVVKMGGSNGVSAGWWPEFYIMTDHYISNGSDSSYQPKFSYYGFNYIQIDNYPGELSADDITIYRVANDVEVTGSFDSSSELINALHHTSVISSQNNFQGKPTDCPVWEKNGWLGDANVMLDSMSSNFDISNFLPNFVEIMEDCYNEYRLVPQMVPTANWGIADHYVWNSLFVLAVENLYNNYGMSSYASEQYGVMAKYTGTIQKVMKKLKYVAPSGQLGDWVSPMGGENDAYNESPNEGSAIVATCYVYAIMRSMQRMAALLGKDSDAKSFGETADSILEAFNDKFYNKKKGYYETGDWNNNGPKRTRFRQTSQLVPLAFGMVPEDRIETVVKNLVDDIIDKDYHLDVGRVGAKEILPVLCDFGYSDIAYAIVTQKTYPSWGFMLEEGSTSLWEMWETTSRSLGHYFLGSYDEWFYQYLAGVRDMKNGFETFTVAPVFVPDLSSVTCTQNTVRGKLESSWTRSADGTLTLKLVVPFGSTAKVVLPALSVSDVTLNGVVITPEMYSVQSVDLSDSALTAVVGSGSYTFVIAAKPVHIA